MKLNSRRSKTALAFALVAAAFAPSTSFAADSVALFLKANGQDIQGESSATSLGRQNSIECLSYQESVQVPTAAASGMATGKRSYGPIIFTKRIDKSSPLLMKALLTNQNIDASFRFYRPNLTGDGTIQQYFTVELKGARLSSIQRVLPNVLDSANAKAPATEEVALVFQNINWTYTTGGVVFEDNAGKSMAMGEAPSRLPLLQLPNLNLPGLSAARSN